MYPFMGITVCGGVSQLLYDISIMLPGVLLALIYYSPVAQQYAKRIELKELANAI